MMSRTVRLALIMCLQMAIASRTYAGAGVHPADSAKLSGRLIGFEVPEQKGNSKFVMAIAKGTYFSVPDFNKHVYERVGMEGGRRVLEVPDFGQDYTWGYSVVRGRDTAAPAHLYHFTTLYSRLVDTEQYRMTVTKAADVYTDGYFFMDCTKAIYDMHGRPVWFLPDTLSPETVPGAVVDIKMTSHNTISYIYNNQFYEVTYDGRLLRNLPPASENVNHVPNSFHHEQQVTTDGTVFVLAMESMWRKKVSAGNVVSRNIEDSLKNYDNLQFGTLVAYDAAGKEKWKWSSSDYYYSSDLAGLRTDAGLEDIGIHMNSFYFDEASKTILIGFRNISRIIKIAYPSGKVLATYGNRVVNGKVPDDYFFSHQHSCRMDKDGRILVYNNNAEAQPPMPDVQILADEDGKGVLKEDWRYACPVTWEAAKARMPVRPNDRSGGQFMNRGGNFFPIDGKYYFVSANTLFNDVFIVDDEKRIQWNVKSEKKMVQNIWVPLPTYRANFISSKKIMEALIWNK